MPLINQHFLPTLGHVSIIITFVVLIVVANLMLSLFSKGGGSGSSGKKPDKKPDPADHPTNFFDSATASLVESTSSESEPESARLPDNFFDSATNAILGKESAEQISEFEKLQAPPSVFDRFAAAMGLQGSPPESERPNPGIDSPSIPPQPFVTKSEAAKAAEEKQKAEVRAKGEEAKAHARAEEGRGRGIGEKNKEGEAKAQETKARVEQKEDAKQKKDAAHEKKGAESIQREEIRHHEMEMKKARAEAEAQARFAIQQAKERAGQLGKQHHAEEAEKKAEAAAKKGEEKKPHGKEPPKPGLKIQPAEQFDQALRALKPYVDELIKYSGGNSPESIEARKKFDKLIDSTLQQSKKIEGEVRDIIHQMLPEQEMDTIEGIINSGGEDESSENSNVDDKDKDDAKGKGNDKDKKKTSATDNNGNKNLAGDNEALDKAILVFKTQNGSSSGIRPTELVSQPYGWNYARAV